MATVADLLKAKPITRVLSIRPDALVLDAVRAMAENNIGFLCVIEGEKLIGVVSERDYTRKIVLEGRTSKDTTVRQIMTTNVVSVGPSHTLDDCMALITGKRIRHLPVVDGDRLMGVISIGDVLKRALEEKERLIKQLEVYISGKTY
jgi:CBS domain-containing protein